MNRSIANEPQHCKCCGAPGFIALDKLLKLMRVVGSGGEAHAVIEEGMVKVNGAVELQKRKKMRAGDYAEFNDEHIKVEA